ncbi:MAG: hypothetical protein MUE41_05725 [Gemmatimonadaceae bacterium]|jgi:hypothetical protein|nr:hypothetical protein [Gemmatimonadaceae bacterium]
MTIWYVDIMWASMLFGITLFTACFVVVNRAMRGMRLMGLITTYGIGAWMLVSLPWKVAVVTWCVFAALGGLVVMAYELWARRRYAGTGRTDRPLILLQGLVLWPSMLPEALEHMVVEIGLLPPSPT